MLITSRPPPSRPVSKIGHSDLVVLNGCRLSTSHRCHQLQQTPIVNSLRNISFRSTSACIVVHQVWCVRSMGLSPLMAIGLSRVKSGRCPGGKEAEIFSQIGMQTAKDKENRGKMVNSDVQLHPFPKEREAPGGRPWGGKHLAIDSVNHTFNHVLPSLRNGQ